MAKIPYSKLKCKTQDNIVTVEIDNIEIEVKQYLPIERKLKIVSWVINGSHAKEYNYSNPVSRKVLLELYLIMEYTNLTFTDTQKKDMSKLYDQLYSSGVLNILLEAIPKKEKELMYWATEVCTDAVYGYQNSILGVLETVKSDYKETDMNIKDMQEQLKEVTNLETIQDVVKLLK